MDNQEQIELERLKDNYDLLRQLRRGGTMATYLARHRELGRDVSITVIRAGTALTHDELAHLAADARLLSAVRHQGVVPVVEACWLSHDALAIVRARVRGSTLRQVLTAAGPLPAERAVEQLRQIGGILEWARRQGVVHRTLSADTVCYQQGSGRILLSFGAVPAVDGPAGDAWPTALGGIPTPLPAEEPVDDSGTEGALLDRCSDAQTLGMLGWEMLTARPAPVGALTADRVRPLHDQRPDVPPALADTIEHALTCDREGKPMELSRFLGQLSAAAAMPSLGVAAAGGMGQQRGTGAPNTMWMRPEPKPQPAAARADVPLRVPPLAPPRPAPVAPVPVTPPRTGAAGAGGIAGSPATSGYAQQGYAPHGYAQQGYGAPPSSPPPADRPRSRQLLTAGAGLLVLGLGAVLFARSGRDDRPDPLRPTTTAQRTDTTSAAGDVALDSAAGTARVAAPSSPGMTAGGAAAMRRPAPTTTARPGTAAPATPTTRGTTRTTRGAAGATSVPRTTTAPSGVAAARTAPLTPTGARGFDACSSAALEDQRTCMNAYLNASDLNLNRVYLELISQLRQRSNTPPGAPDPESVQQLRAEQRAWIDRRDAQCRNAGVARDGAFWGEARARCLGAISAQRTVELRGRL